MRIRLRAKDAGDIDKTAPVSTSTPDASDEKTSHRRSFLKMLGTAAGVAGLAATGQLAYAPKKAEAYDYAANLTVAGNLGIGTEGPTRKLEVVGGGIAMANGDFSAGKGIRFRQTTDNPALQPAGGGMYQSPSDNNLVIEAGANNVIAFMCGGTLPAAAFMGGALMIIPGFVIQPYATDTTSSLQIKTNAGQAYVNFDGVNRRVGVGTVTPSRKLDVAGGGIALDNGDWSTSAGLRFRNATDTTTPNGGGLYQANNNTVYLQAGNANSVVFRDGAGASLACLDGVSFTLATGLLIKPMNGDSTTALRIANYFGAPFVDFDTVNQRVGIGTMSPNASLHVVSTGTENLYLDTYSNDVMGPRIRLRKGRGTLSSPIAVQDGDELGYYLFRGYDGSAFDNAAWMGAFVDGTPGIGSMPARLIFSTTPSGSAASVERMRIDNQGNVGIGAPATSGYRLDVAGTIKGSFLMASQAGVGQANAGSLALKDSSNNKQWQITNRGDADTGNYNKLITYHYDGANWLTTMAIDTAGNVGIGKTNPTGKLDVAGDIFVNGMAAIGSDAVAKQCYYAP